MGEYPIPYGKSAIMVQIPDRFPVDVISPVHAPAAVDPGAAVRQALAHPLGLPGLAAFPKPSRVSIAINDKTRPVPHAQLLPPLLAALEQIGVAPEHITLIIAAGSHPPMKPDEFLSVLPQEILSKYPVICHDAYQEPALSYLGRTSRGTPVWVNRRYLEADLRIVVGNIEPHQFQGFSGGVKSAAIGLAGTETINANHMMMVEPFSRLGEYDQNSARQDVEEIGSMIGVHFALNAILNQDKEIVRVLAGEPLAVMHAGIPIARQVAQVSVPARYRLVIASAGGHPKDINLYQAQKGLAHARLIAQNGARLLLAAACPQGTGSQKYEHWVIGMDSNEAVMDRFAREGFHVGPHKAYQIARDAASVQFGLLSEMEPDFVRQLLIEPISDLQAEIDAALASLAQGERIAVLPHAAATIPYLA